MNRIRLKTVLLACALSLAVASGKAQVHEPFSEKGLPSETFQPGSMGGGAKLFTIGEDDEEDPIDPPKTDDKDKDANSVPAGENMAALALLSIAYGIAKRRTLLRRTLL